MAHSKPRKKSAHKDSKRTQRIMLGLVAGGVVSALGVMALTLSPRESQPVGVGADGFSVFEKKGADLGITKVVSRDAVASALGKKAKGVAEVEKSGVISLNGNVGQTATYNFTLPNGSKAWIDVDLLQYRNQQAYDNDGVFQGTGAAGIIKGHEVRYMPASSLGKERVYALLVTKDLKSYKFAMSQPNADVQIKEYQAQDILKSIIAQSKL